MPVTNLGRGTSSFRGGAYTTPRNRLFALEVDFDMLDLPLLPDAMAETLHVNLIRRLGEAADHVIQLAQGSLRPGHGYDTGLMHDTLVARLGVVFEAVFYDLLSDQAHYWQWVEFGHWMRDGNFWEGYHFLEDAVIASEKHIRSKVVEAYRDTVLALSIEARVPDMLGGIVRGASGVHV